MERQEAILKLKEDLKDESLYRTVHLKFAELQKIELLVVYLSQETEGLSENVLNGFEENEKVAELDKWANYLIEKASRYIQISKDTEKLPYAARYLKEGYQILGRRDFEKFIIAIEFNYPMDMKFYEIRRNVLRDWCKYLEDLEYGRLKGLSISAPPRTGKTRYSEVGSLLGVCCATLQNLVSSCHILGAMAIKIYNDVVNLIEDNKAEIQAIFPNGKIIQKNAEQMFIQLETPYNTGYKTAYFRGIDGNMAGVLEASWLLYCDDLIKNIEEAMNPDRLETARTKYGTDIVQRKANKEVRELHIATRWSTGDVISTLENEHKEDDKWKFIKKPALNEEGKSNFMYKHPFEMDEEYFLERRNSPMMDEISFSCIYQQEPIEREGLWITEDGLHYFNGELPDIECDLICSGCDVAWGGGDYLSMPIAKVFGKAVYIIDVVYNNKTKEVTRPLVIGAILNHKIQKSEFEANNGGDEYCDKVKEELQKVGYRLDIKSRKAPTNKSKTARIQSVTDEVLGLSPEYQVYFLDKEARKAKPMYEAFMKDLFKYNTSAKFIGRQKDDCADSLSMLISNVLEARTVEAKATSNYSRSDLGF